MRVVGLRRPTTAPLGALVPEAEVVPKFMCDGTWTSRRDTKCAPKKRATAPPVYRQANKICAESIAPIVYGINVASDGLTNFAKSEPLPESS